jgi:hypothetical protein
MSLLRDTKARAKRIDLAYFRRRSAFRKAIRVLSIALPAAAGVWVAALAARGDERIYNSGSLSKRHSMLESKCQACHTSEWGERYTRPAAWQESLDVACLRCHAAPVHHRNATDFIRGPAGHETAGRCSECHFEHKGTARLALVGDRTCVACHGDLHTAGGSPPPRIEPHIASFEAGHPEFARVASKAPDPTVLAFNHRVHLHPDTPQKRKLIEDQLEKLAGRQGILAGPGGVRQLSCVYCHPPVGSGAYMAPIRYDSACSDCHPIRWKSERAPHVAPPVLRDFLRSRIAAGGASGTALAEQVTEAEIPLYTSDPDGCMKCHKTDLGSAFPDGPPVVTPTGFYGKAAEPEGSPRRWFPQSTFNHATHRELTCGECHAEASTSQLTSDLLLPGRAICLRCHSQPGGATTACVTCHRFHDRALAPVGDGRLQVGDMLR